jgi:hypothetical protein
LALHGRSLDWTVPAVDVLEIVWGPAFRRPLKSGTPNSTSEDN